MRAFGSTSSRACVRGYSICLHRRARTPSRAKVHSTRIFYFVFVLPALRCSAVHSLPCCFASGSKCEITCCSLCCTWGCCIRPRSTPLCVLLHFSIVTATDRSGFDTTIVFLLYRACSWPRSTSHSQSAFSMRVCQPHGGLAPPTSNRAAILFFPLPPPAPP